MLVIDSVQESEKCRFPGCFLASPIWDNRRIFILSVFYLRPEWFSRKKKILPCKPRPDRLRYIVYRPQAPLMSFYGIRDIYSRFSSHNVLPTERRRTFTPVQGTASAFKAVPLSQVYLWLWKKITVLFFPATRGGKLRLLSHVLVSTDAGDLPRLYRALQALS